MYIHEPSVVIDIWKMWFYSNNSIKIGDGLIISAFGPIGNSSQQVVFVCRISLYVIPIALVKSEMA